MIEWAYFHRDSTVRNGTVAGWVGSIPDDFDNKPVLWINRDGTLRWGIVSVETLVIFDQAKPPKGCVSP